MKTSGIITYLVGALYLQGRLNVTAVWGRGHGPRSLCSADKKWAGHNSVSVNIPAGAILYKLSLVMDVGRAAFSARADASRPANTVCLRSENPPGILQEGISWTFGSSQ